MIAHYCQESYIGKYSGDKSQHKKGYELGQILMVRKTNNNNKKNYFVPFNMPVKEIRPLASSFSTLSSLIGMNLRWGMMSKGTIMCLRCRAQIQSKPAD